MPPKRSSPSRNGAHPAVPFRVSDAEIRRVVAAWIKAGRLNPLPEPSPTPPLGGRGGDRQIVPDTVRELEVKGLDIAAAQRCLDSLYIRVSTWRQAAARAGTVQAAQRRSAELRKLWRHYRNLDRACDDPAFRKETREVLHNALKPELQRIGLILQWVNTGTVPPRPARRLGITAPAGTLASQAFWTQPIITLVDLFAPCLPTLAATYGAVATLLRLEFAYDGTAAQVGQRYRASHGPRYPSRGRPSRTP